MTVSFMMKCGTCIINHLLKQLFSCVRIDIPGGPEAMIMPGDNAEARFSLIRPMPIMEGQVDRQCDQNYTLCSTEILNLVTLSGVRVSR